MARDNAPQPRSAYRKLGPTAKSAILVRAKNLTALRDATTLSIAEFADRVGVPADSWAKYERGARRLTPGLIRTLALVYGVDPDSFDSKSLRTLQGGAFDRSWVSQFTVTPFEERKVLVIGKLEDRISAEVRRFLQAANERQKLGEWLPEFTKLLKRMAAQLDLRPPMELLPSDYDGSSATVRK